VADEHNEEQVDLVDDADEATEPVVDDEGWIHLEHDDTGGVTRIPNRADVLAFHEARGWRVVDPPEQVPFVPAKVDADAEAPPAWVDLVHPDLPAATNRVANNPGALQAALDAGWTYPDPPDDVVKEELRQVRRGRGGRVSSAEREQAEQQAAANAAATDEPPVLDTAPDSPDQPAAGTDSRE